MNFQIFKNASSENVFIEASSGVAACKGFYHYLKYFCGCHVAWEGSQLRLPEEFPEVDIQITAPSKIIYYQNVCTWSYTFSWWSWLEWRKHIDWMALSGITLSLAPFQEDIWTEVYQEYNLTKNEIDNHLSGPGFFAWQRMGNIRGWGGPLTDNFKRFSAELQMKMIQELRNLGIIVALPAFAGHLPVKFQQLFPNNTFTPANRWNRFPDRYASPLFLDPLDPLFGEIGSKFLNKVIKKYGTNHIYFCDPFNEIEPKSDAGDYLANVSYGIYKTMKNVDSKAVWLLQGWMFVKNKFWGDEAIEAFLTAVPQGRMLVLDLQSDQYPQYERTKSYYGKPFIWCMIHTFGGTLGMQGSAEIVYNRILDTRQNSSYTMIGTGITPEGINQNYVVYELALEMGWNTDILTVDDWFEFYSVARYGRKSAKLKAVWLKLLKSVYSFKGLDRIGGKYTYNRRPSLKISPWVSVLSTKALNRGVAQFINS